MALETKSPSWYFVSFISNFLRLYASVSPYSKEVMRSAVDAFYPGSSPGVGTGALCSIINTIISLVCNFYYNNT